ncbi:hypothetical protein EB796_023514 [Bugula neritina]|uniref:Uncharacterized protein n=1 Tax=Bugula neritina TaxID=10212 RepID=A0A7J7IWJ8_BUGNE|nr:hypothetical protein EB796_023514 [Bugula neritina]
MITLMFPLAGQNGGKCGVCGDDYSSTNNQQEPSSGIVPITYNAGQYSKLTTTLEGYFKVRLYYQNNIPQKGSNPSVAAKKYCLNANQKLKASNGDTRCWCNLLAQYTTLNSLHATLKSLNSMLGVPTTVLRTTVTLTTVGAMTILCCQPKRSVKVSTKSGVRTTAIIFLLTAQLFTAHVKTLSLTIEFDNLSKLLFCKSWLMLVSLPSISTQYCFM